VTLERFLKGLAVYRHPRVAAMLFLGFSAGLPFFLIVQTATAWLRQAGVDKGTIGLVTYVGLVYTLKFVWAPIVDRAPLPGLTRWLGRRRAWMLVAQIALAVALALVAHSDPAASLAPMVWLLAAVAFAGATQDIVIDAWRIEAAPVPMQGAMAASYQLGYRVAIVANQGLALYLAGEFGWEISYSVMALLMGVGMLTTLVIPEPETVVSSDTRKREQRVVDWLEEKAHWPAPLRHAGGHFIGAVVCPFADFFQRNTLTISLLILGFIATFRMTDYTMGVMANSFYIEMGYTLQQIAIAAKFFGFGGSIAGVVVGGIAVAMLGVTRALMVGGILVIVTNLAYATLAFIDTPSAVGLGIVVSADNFAYQFAGTSFIAYMSGLTNTAYTATQYALFSSIFALLPKLAMGGSGFVAEALGWPLFFAYTSALGVPALVLLVLLTRRLPDPSSPSASPAKA
jgi:MFS transporter, PAT family, beta-lactamase induction signal transducer AmpG